MVHLFLNEDGQIVIDCPYEQKELAKDAGARWDSKTRFWTFACTRLNLSAAEAKFGAENLKVDSAIYDKLSEWEEKSERLAAIKEMAARDETIRLHIPGLKIQLYNYQKLGIQFALLNGSGVLIADEMGLGKSGQSIAAALIAKRQGIANNCLVVVPASLKFNWPIEIAKFCDEKFVIIDGTAEERIAQWLRDDVFFTIVNYELLLEDLFGGRDAKIGPDLSVEEAERRLARQSKSQKRARILSPVRERIWDMIICDECFPYETMVETEDGLLPIGYIVENSLDLLIRSYSFTNNELSYNRVLRWIKRPLSDKLVEITHEFGKLICTLNHRIWTEEKGYVRAEDLFREDNVHLRILSSSFCEENDSQILQPELCKQSLMEREKDEGGKYGRTKTRNSQRSSEGNSGLSVLWRKFRGFLERSLLYSKILFTSLCKQIQFVQTGSDIEDKTENKNAGDFDKLYGMSEVICCADQDGTRKEILFSEVFGNLEMQERRRSRDKIEENARSWNQGEKGEERFFGFNSDERNEQKSNLSSESDRWAGKMEREESFLLSERGEAIDNDSAKNTLRCVGRWMGIGIQDNGQTGICSMDRESPTVLSDRYSESCIEGGSGSGWTNSFNEKVEGDRQSERESFVLSRMVSIKVLEPGDFERFGICQGKNKWVYNLEIEKDHNYLANGVLVSNCHALKSHNSKRSRNVKNLKGKFRIALTGTPMDGRLEELHSLMEFVMPGILENRTRFMQKHAVTDFFGRVVRYRGINEVKERVAPFFIRRLKRDVLKDLPDKVYVNRVVDLSLEERKVYKQLAKRGHEATEDANAMVAVIRCKQYCDHPGLIGELQGGSKYAAMRELLDELVIQNSHKVLVFTQYAQMANVLCELFKIMGLKFLYICGDTPKKLRADMQAQFNNDKSIDVMIGTEAMSQGLNFTSADIVINYDDNWAPAFMLQREDRCHRIGQKAVVTVINFICRDTIEERIRDVLYAKGKVSSEVLGDDLDEQILKRLGPQDIAKML